MFNNQLELLKNYFYDIIYKDIVTRYEIRDIKNLEKIAYNIISNFTNKISYQSLRNSYDISFDKIKSYISYLVETYLVLELKQFTYSIKKQENLSKKYYVIDNGFIKSIAFKFSENISRILENTVFLELKRRGYEIYYHKDKFEYDFVIKEELEILKAIQVTKSLDDDETKKREIAGLIDAMNKYNLKERLILTQDNELEFIQDKFKIKVMPIYKWLLENQL